VCGASEGASEAFVTLATNDVYGVGAMVLAFTLRQTQTKRDLVVMVTPEISTDMRDLLESAFDLVFEVWPINSNDFDNLCLLNRSVTYSMLFVFLISSPNTHSKQCTL